MKKHLSDFKVAILGLLALPLGLLAFLAYAGIVNYFDPLITIILGGGFVIAILLGLGKLIFNLKDFIVSIFKENKETDEKGFKKHF